MRFNLDILRLRQTPETFPKDRTVSLRVAWLILTPAVSFAVLADAPLFALLPALALLPAVIIRKPVAVTVRATVYSVLFALLTVSILNQVYKIEDERFFLPVDLVMPWTLTVAVCAAYWTQTRGTLTFIMVLSLFAMLTHGTCLNDPRFVRLPLGAMWRDRFFVFGVFTVSEIMALLALWPRLLTGRPAAGRRRWDWRRVWRLALAWLILAKLTSLTIQASLWTYDRFDPLFTRIFTDFVMRRSPRLHFPREVNLWQTVPRQAELQRPILRLRATRPPMYLRARAFLDYREGRWRGGNEDLALPGAVIPGNEVAWRYDRFPERPSEDLPHRLDIYPAAGFRSDVLFLPGGGRLIELVSASLRHQPEEGSVRPDAEWDPGAGYTIWAVEEPPATVYPRPAAPTGDAWLQLPDELRDPLTALLAGDGAPPSDPAAVVRRTADLLGAAPFEYALGVRLHGTRDPVLQFLEEARAGHCELFASAAVLLARAGGVPARYVTGAVVAERQARDGWWIVRTRDLHAWAEVWLPEQGGWVLLETTPAAGIPLPRPGDGFWRTLVEYPRSWLAQILALVKRGYFAAAVFTLLGAAGRGLVWLLATGPWFLSWPALALAILVLWRYWLRRQRAAAAARAPARAELAGVWRLLDRHLTALGIVRAAGTSLGELAARVRAEVAAEAPVLPVLAEYERLRYAPEPPAAAAIKMLADRAAALARRSREKNEV